jgi:hypothetical protein
MIIAAAIDAVVALGRIEAMLRVSPYPDPIGGTQLILTGGRA